MENLLEKLNKEQFEAVTHKDGPLLIVAGAGTGKTTVITQRIAYLIEQGHAKSDEILALTFTEKAAGEMEERVDRLLPMGYLDLWISTFHSFGERILKEHGLSIGLPTDFKLLNEFEQYALVKKNLDKFELDYYRPIGNPTKFIRALIKHFSRAKDEDISPAEYMKYAEELRENMDNVLGGSKKKITNYKLQITNITNSKGKVDKEMLAQEVLRINEVANAYHVYQQLLLDNSALDFGDLINYCLKLFRDRPAVLEKYRKQFKYILLDEFQDTNWAQYELIKILSEPKNNLVVVGDDDQSIYKFRGASVSNILQFKKDFQKAKEIFLINNYRNKQNILDLSYDFIRLNDPNRLEFELNKKSKNKFSKKLKAQTKDQGIIEVIEGSDLNDEVRQVVEKIADLKIKDKEINWSDFAILVRANDSAKDFCNALDIAGLPYQFLSSRGLYSRPIILDLISYLRLLDNYHENNATYRVLNIAVFNFTHHENVNFNYWAYKKTWSLYETLKSISALGLGREIQEKVSRLLGLIEKHTALTRDKKTSEIVIAFLNDSGYLKYLTSQEDQKSQENIQLLNKFLKRIQEFESGSDDTSVKAFLDELNMEIDAGEEGSLPFDIESGPDTIKIMTVHGAKGLEFKYVFITNMVDKRFPTIERKEPILIPDQLVKEILPEGDIHTEEERRLFYVAITRAKRGIYFSWAPDYGGVRLKKPSKFLVEIGLISEKKEEKKASKKTFKDDLAIKEKRTLKADTQEIRMPNYFSYTQIAAFSNCPYQYRFAHILRIPRRGKAVFSFGKTMHSTLQKLFILVNEKKGLGQTDLFSQNKLPKKGEKIKISIDEINKLYEESWVDDWYENKNQKKEYKEKGKAILKEFYEMHKDNWPNAILLEKGFNIKFQVDGESNTMRGNMDRIDEENGKIKIVDYKTGAPKEKLSFDEKEQLFIYQLAAQEVFSQEIESLSFYYLENNSKIEFLGTDEDLKKTRDKVIKTIKEIKKCEFPPKPGPLCAFCDFKDICEFRKI